MTLEEQQIEVAQSDREAAMHPRVSVGYTNKTKAKILRGEKDTDPLVQAFAKHRAAATNEAAAKIERLREALLLADAALRGANMDMNAVEQKVAAVLGSTKP